MKEPSKKSELRSAIITGVALAGGVGAVNYAGYKILNSTGFKEGVGKKFEEVAKVRMGGTPDDIGGTTEDKLDRLHRRAKGTPEGDAALQKLTILRSRKRNTVIKRARTSISKIASKFAPRKVGKLAGHLLSARERLNEVIEFAKYKRPEIIENPFVPAGAAAYETPSSARLRSKKLGALGGGFARPGTKARAGGIIHESVGEMPADKVLISGHANSKSAKAALLRHELIHSIQASKRGYRTHPRIRDLIKDEVGAYSEMNRRVKGGSKILRGANSVAGVGLSAAIGTIGSPRLRRRAGRYALIGAGAIAGGSALTKVLRKKKETQMAARDTLNQIIELKAVDLGYSYGSEGMASPCSAEYATKRHYPCLYISDRENDIGLPLSGTAKVRFKTRSKTARQDESGKTRHSADIEIHSIDVLEADAAPSKKLKEGAPAKLNTYGARLGEIIELARGDYLKKVLRITKGQSKGNPKTADWWEWPVVPSPRGHAHAIDDALEVKGALGKMQNPGYYGTRNGAERLRYRDYERKLLGRKNNPNKPVKFSARDHLASIIEFNTGEAVGEGITRALRKINAINRPINRGAGRVVKRKFYPKQWDRIGKVIPVTPQTLSARLDGIISFAADPRSRNRLGMFDGGEEGAPDPNAIDSVYKTRVPIGQNLAGGAVAGVGAAASGSALKALFNKLKKVKA